ncbi:MAG: hypothetical protein ABL974_04770 [Prosthecobacter sp.]
MIACLALLPFSPVQQTYADEWTEEWHMLSQQSMYSVTLTAGENIEPGQVNPLSAHVTKQTWEIWESDWGGIETRNDVTSPVVYASLSLNQVSGPGYVHTFPGGTDWSGNATGGFLMGDSDSVVTLEVGVNGYMVTSATVTLTPWIETWSYSHTESSLASVQTLNVEGGTNIVADEQRTLIADVMENYWEVWTSTYGNTEQRNSGLRAAVTTPVTFAVTSGDGVFVTATSPVASYTTNTDSSGRASATFTMGAGDSSVSVSAEDAGANIVSNGTGEIGFTQFVIEEDWTYLETNSWLDLALSVHGSVTEMTPGETRPLYVYLASNTVDVYTSNLGNTEYRNPTSTPAPGETLTFTLEQGEGGSLAATTVTTDVEGRAAVDCQMGAGALCIRTDALDGSGNVMATDTLDIAYNPEMWTHTGDEGTISLTLTPNGDLTDLPQGTQREITAEVRYLTWEVWTSNLGNTDLRNETDSAAASAGLTFEIESGSGTLSQGASPTSVIQTSTNTSGQASVTFTMGSSNSRLRVDTEFATASAAAALDLTPEPWIYSHSISALDMQMLGSAQTVVARVSRSTADIYTLASDTTRTEQRNPTSGPAIGAAVTFSTTAGNLSVSSGTTNENGDVETLISGLGMNTALITASASFSGDTAENTMQVTGTGGLDDQMDDQTVDQMDDQTVDQTVDQMDDQLDDQGEDQGDDQTEDTWTIDEATIEITGSWSHKAALNNAAVVPMNLGLSGSAIFPDATTNTVIIWSADARVQYVKAATGERVWKTGVREVESLTHLHTLAASSPIYVGGISTGNGLKILWNIVKANVKPQSQAALNGIGEELANKVTQTQPTENDIGTHWIASPTPPE